jgi:hypothetical protein
MASIGVVVLGAAAVLQGIHARSPDARVLLVNYIWCVAPERARHGMRGGSGTGPDRAGHARRSRALAAPVASAPPMAVVAAPAFTG